MKRSIALLIIFCLFLTGCSQYVYKSNTVVGTVTSLEHENTKQIPYSFYNSTTDTVDIRYRIEPEHNYITVSYGNIVETFDDEDLFETVKVGSSIELNLIQTFDEDNNLVKEELELID